MEEKEEKKKKSNFCKPGTTEPAMQNSVEMSLHVVNVSLQMKTYWIQVYTNRSEGVFFWLNRTETISLSIQLQHTLFSDGLLAQARCLYGTIPSSIVNLTSISYSIGSRLVRLQANCPQA